MHLCSASSDTSQQSDLIIRSAAALQAFFADIYAEARKAKPGLGHRALAQVAGAHKLLRHYTMNIDGLAEAAGMDTWHVDNNPAGKSCSLLLPLKLHAAISSSLMLMYILLWLRHIRSAFWLGSGMYCETSPDCPTATPVITIQNLYDCQYHHDHLYCCSHFDSHYYHH